MEFIEAIIAYVDAKINYELAALDPGGGEYYSLNDECKQMEAAREQLLAFTESEELRVLRAVYNFVKLAMENPTDDSYAWLTAAIDVAEKALIAID